MIRFCGIVALVFAISASKAHADQFTLYFAGTITEVKDASAVDPDNPGELLDLEFPPIPVNSPFAGAVTYDITSPLTDINLPGFARYLDLLSSTGSLAINGIDFVTGGTQGVSAQVSSQEANVGFSGVNYINNDLSLPAGWTVTSPLNPYFTLQFWDDNPETRSLALPASEIEIPTDVMNLVLDFRQSVIIDGQTFGGRVFIRGQMTSITVSPQLQEVAIDVDPSSAKNKLNLNTKHPKPLDVAVFGAEDFDVQDIVADTVELGDPVLTDPETGLGQKVAPTSFTYEDVNGDGMQDLLLIFDLRDLQELGAIDYLTKSLEFQALLGNNGVVFGSDMVSISGAKGKEK